MLEEPDLFGNDNARALARRCDPDTSHMAAKETTPLIRELQRRVLAFAASRGPGGFTDPELNAHFGVASSTYRTRRAELVDMGLVEDTGQRRLIGTKGRPHAVWRITDTGTAQHQRLVLAGLDRAA